LKFEQRDYLVDKTSTSIELSGEAMPKNGEKPLVLFPLQHLQTSKPTFKKKKKKKKTLLKEHTKK